MLAPSGRATMASNLATTVAINNQATPPQRAQALIDALITGENANVVADGLGVRMATIYRDQASYVSDDDDDGATPRCGQIGPAVTVLIAAANATSRGDAGTGKFGFADEKAQLFSLPSGGVYDVIGKAYHLPAGSTGADTHGNSRPFQTAPLDATSGPSIQTYDGTDFFGVATNSRLMLTGATLVDKVAGRTGSDLGESPSFPSGHTTFGYTESLILGMMVPERLRALAYRGSEYGNSRIVVGAHYAIDVIAGRTLATYDLAHDLAGTRGYARVPGQSFRAALSAGAELLRAHLQAKGCPSIAACAADPIVRADNASILDKTALKPATAEQAYRFRLNYGLTPLGSVGLPPEPVPAEAGALLQTRFPYMTPAQRLDVLRTTEGPSGYFLDASPIDGSPLSAGVPISEAGVYSRLDLYAAAGGYASLTGQVVLNQDAASVTEHDLQPFLELARADTWSNNMGGAGGLTKRGAGTLTLSGTDTYAGPTIVESGALQIVGSLTSAIKVGTGGTLAGTGRVGNVDVSRGGVLDGHGPLGIRGALTMGEGATLVVRATTKGTDILRVAGRANLGGTHLVVKSDASLQSGMRYTILTALGGLSGTFADVATDTPSLRPYLSYAADAVYLTFDKTNPDPAQKAE